MRRLSGATRPLEHSGTRVTKGGAQDCNPNRLYPGWAIRLREGEDVLLRGVVVADLAGDADHLGVDHRL